MMRNELETFGRINTKNHDCFLLSCMHNLRDIAHFDSAYLLKRNNTLLFGILIKGAYDTHLFHAADCDNYNIAL
jgi:hypothetical protein